MKQDWGDQINPTMIWGRMCRTLLVDKGKPLSGDKGTRTDKHVCAYKQDRSAYCTRSERYMNDPLEEKTEGSFGDIDWHFLVVR